MTHRGRVLLSSAAAISLAIPVAAKAQQTKSVNIEEVVVTAQRRSERLQDVPLSVTAVTTKDLRAAGVEDTRDLSLVTPGLRMTQSGVYMQPSIRGVTTNRPVPTEEANIATYIDGVYMANTLGALYQLPDIRQVEVLKGPQGTLFGRNATGGAILINSFDPDLSTATGDFSLGYSSFNTKTAKGFASMPLAEDKLAISLTGYYEDTDGYQRNLLKGGRRGDAWDKTWMFRGKVRFKIGEHADFVVSGLYTKSDDHQSLKQTDLGGRNSLAALGPLFGMPNVIISSRPNDFAMNVDNRITPIQKQLSLRGTIDMGPGTLTTTTALNKTTTYLVVDADGLSLPLGQVTFNTHLHTFSQEFLYTTNQLGPVRATVGAFYFSAHGGLDPLFFPPSTTIWTNDKDESWAGFGELTYNITDKLELTGGLRYSWEKRWAYAATSQTGVFPGYFFHPTHSWHSVTPRFSLLYRVTPDTNVYFTYSKGFKSGEFNTTGFQPTPANPEKVTAYEVGVKSRVTSNFSVNGSAFFNDYKDLQVTSLQQVGLAFVSTLNNAATARIYGLEVSGSWIPVDPLRISFGAAWTHARYKDYKNASVNFPNASGGFDTRSTDVSGNTMIRSPAFTGNVTAVYTWDTPTGDVEFAGSAYYSSKIYFEEGNRVTQPGYETINLSLAWRPNKVNGIELKAFGRNLTNRDVIASYGGGTTHETVVYLPPRSFGVEASYRF
jgi:iron complex outermembrane receptor protein